jgi:hypothetical protein
MTNHQVTLKIEEINKRLFGFTDVLRLDLRQNAVDGSYDMEIVLANSSGSTTTLSCADISGLRLTGFGGGLTQILGLRGTDVRLDQLDRVNIHFSDSERDAIAFDCSQARMTNEVD